MMSLRSVLVSSSKTELTKRISPNSSAIMTPSVSISRMGSIRLSHSGVSPFIKSFASLPPCTAFSFLLTRVATKPIQNLLDVHVARDKLCSLPRHGAQHPFPALVDERDFVEIHDAPAPPDRAMCPHPTRFQFIDPRRNQTTLQDPTLYGRGMGDCDFQHFFLFPHRGIASAGPQDSI